MAKLNIDPSRKLSTDFSKTPMTRRLGPKPVENSLNALEEAQAQGNQTVEVDEWQVMDVFDEGLRNALINWVNQTKEGRTVTSLTGSTRSKQIDFQFYGNPSKDIVGVGDIGQFSLVFKYTRKIVQAAPNQVITR
jgi:hypothetical protein